jgi:hypothetical protein
MSGIIGLTRGGQPFDLPHESFTGTEIRGFRSGAEAEQKKTHHYCKSDSSLVFYAAALERGGVPFYHYIPMI